MSPCQPCQLLRRELRSDHRDAAEGYLAGGDLVDAGMEELCGYIGKLRIIRTNERPGEEQHAKVHKKGMGRHYHTEQFMSYGLRSPEIAAEINASPDTVSELAFFTELACNPQKAAAALGITGHPAVTAVESQVDRRSRRSRDPIFGKVIYHTDPYTLYSAAAPLLEFGDDDDDDPDSCAPDKAGDTPGDVAYVGPHVAGPSGCGGGVCAAGGSSGGSGHSHAVGSLSTSGGSSAKGAGQGPSGNPSGCCGATGGADAPSGSGGSGQAPAGKPPRTILERHHACLDMIKKYLVAFLLLRMKEADGAYFSVKLAEGAVSTLEQKLLPEGAVETATATCLQLAVPSELLVLDQEEHEPGQPGHVSNVSASKFAKMVRNAVFFRLVRRAPGKLKLRNRKANFDNSDNAVSLHEVVDVDLKALNAYVDIASTKLDPDTKSMSMVLSLAAFPLSQLVSMMEWTCDDMRYGVSRIAAGECIPTECKGSVGPLIKNLLECDTGEGVELDTDNLLQSEAMDCLVEVGFATPSMLGSSKQQPWARRCSGLVA